jgi:pyrimidine deaminase RibD-like protein
MRPTYIQLAFKEAVNCTTHRQRVGAVVVRGGRVLAKASNQSGRHAEVRALSQLWGSECAGTTVYVARLPRDVTVARSMARPCAKCERFMRRLGVKRVVYTTFSGTISEERL